MNPQRINFILQSFTNSFPALFRCPTHNGTVLLHTRVHFWHCKGLFSDPIVASLLSIKSRPDMFSSKLVNIVGHLKKCPLWNSDFKQIYILLCVNRQQLHCITYNDDTMCECCVLLMCFYCLLINQQLYHCECKCCMCRVLCHLVVMKQSAPDITSQPEKTVFVFTSVQII